MSQAGLYQSGALQAELLLLVPVGKPFPGLSLILGIGDGAEAVPAPVTISLL